MKIFKTEIIQKVLWLRDKQFGRLVQWKIAEECNISIKAVRRILKAHSVDKVPRKLLKGSRIPKKGIHKTYPPFTDERGDAVSEGKMYKEYLK